MFIISPVLFAVETVFATHACFFPIFAKKSLDDIYMYIGNVTELFLTGNEISSTRGLDRIFSLEHLALDENKLNQLTHIVGLANLPFLMNLDLKGNPFEVDGT
jgi:Leucine-rich repeat (LRR) protein